MSAREPIITGDATRGPDPDRGEPRSANDLSRRVDAAEEKLRPQRLGEVIGQRAVAERLAIALEAAQKRGEPLPHILFDGPPGLGNARRVGGAEIDDAERTE